MTAVLLLAAALSAGPAAAYEHDEHEIIGRESYTAACARLSSETTPWRAPEHTARLALVCGHVETQAELFGQMTALAGDYASSPEALQTSKGRRQLHSVQNFLWLALGNDAHFHPEAPRVWSHWHQVALDMAADAAQLDGLAQVDAVDELTVVLAFGAHFLHDGHASGHMGIDRAASSAGAAHTFHDYWNRKGRTVRDRNGEQWTTYGDGQLGRDRMIEGRARLVETATRSIEDVLRAFVEGTIEPERQLAVWDRLPYEMVDASTFFVEGLILPSVRIPREAIEPVSAFRRPARITWTFEAWFTSNRVLDDQLAPLSGVVLGTGVAFPIERFPMRATVGLGVGRSGDGDGALLDLGYTLPMGRSVLGAVQHDLVLGSSLQLGGGAPLSASSWHFGYRMELQLGRFLLRGSVGPALIYPSGGLGIGQGRAGWTFNLGAGTVLAVSNSARL